MAKSVDKKPETESTKPQGDTVTRLLEEAGEPVNRENYLNLAYLGNPPQELDPEVEEAIPPQARWVKGE